MALLEESKHRMKKLNEIVQEKEETLEEDTRQRERVKNLCEEVQKLDEGWLQGYNDRLGRTVIKFSPFVTFACQANLMQGQSDNLKVLQDVAKKNAAEQMKTLSESADKALQESDIAKTMSESATGAARTLMESEVAKTMSESAAGAAGAARGVLPSVPENPT